MNILQNIQKSQQLQSEVEAFLASGGRIKHLGVGETQHSKGYVPQISATPVSAKNTHAAKATEKPKNDKKQKQLEEQLATIEKFEKRAKKGHYAMLARLAGVPRSSLTNLKIHCMANKAKWQKIKKLMDEFDFTAGDDNVKEQQRRNKVCAAKEEALKNGQSHFTAPCKWHGETRFYINAGKPICVKCNNEAQRNLRSKKKVMV